MTLTSEQAKKLEEVAKKLKTSRKRLLALESEGVEIKAPKRIRKWLDKGKEVA